MLELYKSHCLKGDVFSLVIITLCKKSQIKELYAGFRKGDAGRV